MAFKISIHMETTGLGIPVCPGLLIMIDPSDNFTLPLLLAEPVEASLESRDMRFTIGLTKDLIEDWSVVCEWCGPCGRRRHKTTVVPDYKEGMALMAATIAAQKRRGLCPPAAARAHSAARARRAEP